MHLFRPHRRTQQLWTARKSLIYTKYYSTLSSSTPLSTGSTKTTPTNATITPQTEALHHQPTIADTDLDEGDSEGYPSQSVQKVCGIQYYVQAWHLSCRPDNLTHPQNRSSQTPCKFVFIPRRNLFTLCSAPASLSSQPTGPLPDTLDASVPYTMSSSQVSSTKPFCVN